MPPSGHGTKLFINYRRDDTAPYAGRLYDRLAAHFGEDQVFMDIDQIEPGEDFVEVINSKVGACEIAIISIGPNWLTATDESGQRRLDDSEDFVRMEIVAALERKIRVIPVLVGGARMPRRQELPEALAPLSRRNALELSETRFHSDVSRLIEAIEKARASSQQKVAPSATPAAPVTGPAMAAERESKDPRDARESQAVSGPFKSRVPPVAKPVAARVPKSTDTVTNADLLDSGRILRHKIRFYVIAWILAFLVMPLSWDVPKWLVRLLTGYDDVGFWLGGAVYLIHAIIYFWTRSHRMTLILFGILLALLEWNAANCWFLDSSISLVALGTAFVACFLFFRNVLLGGDWLDRVLRGLRALIR